MYVAQTGSFGLLCDVNKFPLDLAARSECIELGLRMSWQSFLHIGLWGFMDNLVVMKPPKPMQLGLCYKSHKPAQVQRYHMVLEFSGENIVAQAMVQEADKGTWLIKSDHPHFIDWGTLRTDLDLLEVSMKTNLLTRL